MSSIQARIDILQRDPERRERMWTLLSSLCIFMCELRDGATWAEAFMAEREYWDETT
jgi:hypothetical protein